MLITRVELKNIKNHADAEWNFLPGVIAICGPNGSGKTTIVEAIAWALFDELNYKREDFVKRGEKKGQVVVSFISDLDGREYTVQRDTSGSYFVCDPVTKGRLAEQKNQVLPWLCQHLGVDPGTDIASIFRTTIGVPQGSFTYDFTLRPGERKGVFDRTLKVDEYRDASDRLRDTLRHVDFQLSNIDLSIAAAEGELKAYEVTKREYAETLARQTRLSKEHQEARDQRDRLANEVAELDDWKRQADAHRSAAERLDVRLKLTRDKLTSAREAAEQAHAAAAVIEAARPGYESYVAAVSRLHELEREREARDRLRHQLAAVERRQIETRAQIEHTRERLREIDERREELIGLTSQIEKQSVLETQIATLRESRGERQSLERLLTQVDGELEQLRKRYSSCSYKLQTAEAQRELAQRTPELEQELGQLDSQISRQEIALNSLQLKREHLERLRGELRRLSDEHERSSQECARLEALVGAEARVATIEDDHRREAGRLAQLRAEVERDAMMITGLEDGRLCPLLTEKCLNLKPGESLDGRFRENLAARRDEIVHLENALPALAADLRAAQKAAAEVSRLPRLQSELKRISGDVAMQRAQVDRLDGELIAGSAHGGIDLEALKDQRRVLEVDVRAAREAQQAYAQARAFRSELESIAGQGRAKKESRGEIVARITVIDELEINLTVAESELQALGDPRGRALGLRQQVARAEEWQSAIVAGEREAADITREQEAVSGELENYAKLDLELASTSHTRAASERDYRLFIGNEKIAATGPRREQQAIEIAAEVTEAEKALDHAQSEYARLASLYDADRHAGTRADLEQWRHTATQLATQLEHADEQAARVEKELIHLDEVRDRLYADVAERSRLNRLHETTEFIRNILQQAAPYITEAYLCSISHEANQLYREITGRQDVTLQWTRDYEITLEEGGLDRGFGNLSGGEQMAAALAIRMALLRELSEINLAFFDEPTANLDEERRSNLAQQIGRIKDFQQLFIISHDDSFESYTDQVVVLGK